MVLLFLPFRNENIDMNDRNEFLELYNEKLSTLLENEKKFFAKIDIDELTKTCENISDDSDTENEYKTNSTVTSSLVFDNVVSNYGKTDVTVDNLDIFSSDKVKSIIKSRCDILSHEEYCEQMRQTNARQKALILELIYRMFFTTKPMQIFFTGPAGSGKSFTLKLAMETVNRSTPLTASN